MTKLLLDNSFCSKRKAMSCTISRRFVSHIYCPTAVSLIMSRIQRFFLETHCIQLQHQMCRLSRTQNEQYPVVTWPSDQVITWPRHRPVLMVGYYDNSCSCCSNRFTACLPSPIHCVGERSWQMAIRRPPADHRLLRQQGSTSRIHRPIKHAKTWKDKIHARQITQLTKICM